MSRIKSDPRETLNLQPEKIKVYSTLVCGGFGNKVPLHAEYMLALLASMKLDRPKKWIETRSEHLKNPTIGVKSIIRSQNVCYKERADTRGLKVM